MILVCDVNLKMFFDARSLFLFVMVPSGVGVSVSITVKYFVNDLKLYQVVQVVKWNKTIL